MAFLPTFSAESHRLSSRESLPAGLPAEVELGPGCAHRKVFFVGERESCDSRVLARYSPSGGIVPRCASHRKVFFIRERESRGIEAFLDRCPPPEPPGASDLPYRAVSINVGI